MLGQAIIDKEAELPAHAISLDEQVADEVLDALARRCQIGSIGARFENFDLAAAYRVAALVRAKRVARGERAIGRKLGFTNRNIWDEYHVYAPIWSYMYDSTVEAADPAGVSFDMSRVVEPRIEPEITLSLAQAPEPGMDEEALLGCIDWVAQASRSCSRCFRPGNSCAPILSLHSVCTARCCLGPRMPSTIRTGASGWLA